MKIEVEFLQDYRVAEFPQHGNNIIDAKKGDKEFVSLDLLEVLGDKVKEVVEEVVEEVIKENEEDKCEGKGEGESEGEVSPESPLWKK